MPIPETAEPNPQGSNSLHGDVDLPDDGQGLWDELFMPGRHLWCICSPVRARAL